MIKAIVSGASGRMGKLISQLILAESDFALVGGLERKDHPAVGRDLGEVIGADPLGVQVGDTLEAIVGQGEVLIEFTSPNATQEHLVIAARHETPMVIGTTGLSPQQLARIHELSNQIPCICSPNMSVGVNLMYALIEKAAGALGEGYDVEIIEAHHRLKVDAPSGTALKLAEVLAEATGRDLARSGVYGRKGSVGERKNSEIGIHAVRAGDIVGEHTVIFGGMGERIEIIHRAQSRENFARGALRAARWIVGQKPGLYSMRDVLGF